MAKSILLWCKNKPNCGLRLESRKGSFCFPERNWMRRRISPQSTLTIWVRMIRNFLRHRVLKGSALRRNRPGRRKSNNRITASSQRRRLKVYIRLMFVLALFASYMAIERVMTNVRLENTNIELGESLESRKRRQLKDTFSQLMHAVEKAREGRVIDALKFFFQAKILSKKESSMRQGRNST